MQPDLWRRVYESPWHNPGFFWLCGGLFFLGMGLQQGGLGGFLLIFGFTTLADCTLTGGWTPIPSGTLAGTLTSILFVILGDLRYLLLIEALRGGEGLGAPALRRATALALVVPLLAFGARNAWPLFLQPRPFFLLYELLFFALALGVGLAALRKLGDDADAPLVRALLAFELIQYGLWALADVLLLADLSPGHLLRLVPNAMYYAFFLPFVWRVASRSRRLA
ncbi:MAG: hypothetical protein MUF64_22315 [Polyangiaceae bacterium]|jgi:hypothetical protein|nr:hypothetical protein [Polyangiaceae bacterium]